MYLVKFSADFLGFIYYVISEFCVESTKLLLECTILSSIFIFVNYMFTSLQELHLVIMFIVSTRILCLALLLVLMYFLLFIWIDTS